MTRDRLLFVLIHSPLTGPQIWSGVAAEIVKRGLAALIPPLDDSPESEKPFWEQHARSVWRTLAPVAADTPLVLVAHSGAGPLLPAIRHGLRNPVRAYAFVDAGLPRDKSSRLDLMRSEDPAWAFDFEEKLQRGESFPTWSVDDLEDLIPDASLRRQTVAGLRPRQLDFFTEPIPVFAGWPDARGIYIQFSDPYERVAAQARLAGFKVWGLKAGHFHMLVDPGYVTDLLVTAAEG